MKMERSAIFEFSRLRQELQLDVDAAGGAKTARRGESHAAFQRVMVNAGQVLSREQLLDKVWFTYATPDGWKSTDDPSKVIR